MSPEGTTPTTNPFSIISYHIGPDGSLNQVGSVDKSLFPFSVFEGTVGGPWLFACDLDSTLRPGRCLEFRLKVDGSIVPGADISGMGFSHVAAVDPSGEWLLTFDFGTLGTRIFRIRADGSLLLGPTPLFQNIGMAGLDLNGRLAASRFDPTGNFFIARDVSDASTTSGIYRFDAATGTFSFASSLPAEFFRTRPLGFSADGKRLLQENTDDEPDLPADIYVFSWDSQRGVLALSGRLHIPFPEGAVYAAADNLLFVVSNFSNGLKAFRVDPATLSATDTGQFFSPDGDSTGQLVVNSKSHTMMLASPEENIISVSRYDPATGKVIEINGSPYSSCQNVMVVSLLQN
ncbi:MAG TPA: hypothetical protein VJA94_09705 [Candidatus Angelobacter sp.]